MSFCLRWIAFWAVYMVLAGKWKPDELLAGGLVGAACAGLAHALQPMNNPGYRMQARWTLNLLQSVLKAFPDSFKVLGAAIGSRDLIGRVQSVPFNFGQRAEDLGRTALVTETLCLTPNTVVLECDPEREVLLVHELVPSSSPVGNGNAEWPS